MRIEKLILYLAVLVAFGSGSMCFSQQEPTDIQSRTLSDVRIEAPNLLVALSQLSDQFDIPIGLNYATNTNLNNDRAVKISVSRGTVSQVLNEILRQDERFTWSSSLGVIHVKPVSRLEDQCLEKLLALPIQTFKAEKRITYSGLRSKIYSLPEFGKHVASCHLEIDRSIQGSRDFAVVLRDQDLIMNNVSIEEIFDGIISTPRARFWVLNKTGPENKYMFVNF